MERRLIAALAALLLASGAALAQDPGDRRAREPRPAQRERLDERDRRPEAERRSRIDRAQDSIRERRRQGGRDGAAPSQDGDGTIYRRSNNYRRW